MLRWCFLASCARFLSQGDKVKAVVQFRGREITHQEIGRQVIARLIEDLAQFGQVENRPRMEGNLFAAMIAPVKKQTGKPAAAAQTQRQ